MASILNKAFEAVKGAVANVAEKATPAVEDLSASAALAAAGFAGEAKEIALNYINEACRAIEKAQTKAHAAVKATAVSEEPAAKPADETQHESKGAGSSASRKKPAGRPGRPGRATKSAKAGTPKKPVRTTSAAASPKPKAGAKSKSPSAKSKKSPAASPKPKVVKGGKKAATPKKAVTPKKPKKAVTPKKAVAAGGCDTSIDPKTKRPSARKMLDSGCAEGTEAKYADGTIKCLKVYTKDGKVVPKLMPC